MAASDPLVGFHAKIDRAKEHLHALDVSIGTYLADSEAYSIRIEIDAERRVHNFWFRQHKVAPVVRWSVLIGDCVHNTRSALDHLFWSLILLKHPSGITDKTAQFPICSSKEYFMEKWESKLNKWLGHRAAAMIQNVQPFNGPDVTKNAYVLLNERDIADKHKLLVPAFAFPTGIQLEFELKNADSPFRIPKHEHFITSPFEEETMFHRFTLLDPQSVVKVDFGIPISIVFEPKPPDVYPVVPLLNGLIGVVEALGRDFCLFFNHDASP